MALSLAGCSDTSTAGASNSGTQTSPSATASATPSEEPTSTEPVLIPVQRTPLAGVEMPTNMDEYGGISLGQNLVAGTKNDGAPVVTIYSDPFCPYCNLLEQEYGKRLESMAQSGKITLVNQPNLRFAETQFSPLSLQAEVWFAANHPDKYKEFHSRLYADIAGPVTTRDGEPVSHEERVEPAMSRVYELAGAVGLTQDDVAKLRADIEANPYRSLLEQLRQRFLDDGFKYVPTVMIDDMQLEDYSEGKLGKILDEIEAGTWQASRGAGGASPSAPANGGAADASATPTQG